MNLIIIETLCPTFPTASETIENVVAYLTKQLMLGAAALPLNGRYEFGQYSLRHFLECVV